MLRNGPGRHGHGTQTERRLRSAKPKRKRPVASRRAAYRAAAKARKEPAHRTRPGVGEERAAVGRCPDGTQAKFRLRSAKPKRSVRWRNKAQRTGRSPGDGTARSRGCVFQAGISASKGLRRRAGLCTGKKAARIRYTSRARLRSTSAAQASGDDALRRGPVRCRKSRDRAGTTGAPRNGGDRVGAREGVGGVRNNAQEATAAQGGPVRCQQSVWGGTNPTRRWRGPERPKRTQPELEGWDKYGWRTFFRRDKRHRGRRGASADRRHQPHPRRTQGREAGVQAPAWTGRRPRIKIRMGPAAGPGPGRPAVTFSKVSGSV